MEREKTGKQIPAKSGTTSEPQIAGVPQYLKRQTVVVDVVQLGTVLSLVLVLSVSSARVVNQKEGLVNFSRVWRDVHSTHVKERKTWTHRMVSRICLITCRPIFEH